jgi:plastocyanin
MKKILYTTLFTFCFISTITAQVVVSLQGISFVPADITINVGETVQWDNVDGFHNVNGSQATFPNNPEGFFSGDPASGPWSFSFTFNTAGSYDYRCDVHFGNGMVGTVTVLGSQYPEYPIGVVSSVDADGVADSLGVECQITGIVYGVNLRPGGLQMTVIDQSNANDGIGVFSFSDDWGYTVEEGDEVVIQGTISQFNGLTQINPDTVWMVSSGNMLHDSEVVTDLSEDTESKLVTFENMTFVDVNGDWTGTGSGFNVDITDGVNTYTMRIDNDVDLYNMPAPTFTNFNVTGLGGQFDNSSPFLDGYQLLPRYMEDLEEIVGDELEAIDDSYTIEVNEQGNFDVLSNDNLPNGWVSVIISTDVTNGTTTISDSIVNYTPEIDYCGDDSFSYIVCDNSTCDTATVSITINCPISYPQYPIGVISSVDADGVADSLGVSCEITGILYGVNQRQPDG